MTMHPLLRQWQGRLRRRAIADVLIWAPAILAATVLLVSRFASVDIVLVAIGVAVAVLVFLLVRAWRAIDAKTAVRSLDAQSSDVEDSADLLLEPSAEISAVQTLQRERVLAHLRQHLLPTIPRAPIPRFVWPLGGVLVFLLLASLFLRGKGLSPDSTPEPTTPTAVASTQAVIRSARIAIEAPAYTGLPPRTESTLETEAAEGSRLRWLIQFEPDPDKAKLVFHDGKEVALTRLARRSYAVGVDLVPDRCFRITRAAR